MRLAKRAHRRLRAVKPLALRGDDAQTNHALRWGATIKALKFFGDDFEPASQIAFEGRFVVGKHNERNLAGTKFAKRLARQQVGQLSTQPLTTTPDVDDNVPDPLMRRIALHGIQLAVTAGSHLIGFVKQIRLTGPSRPFDNLRRRQRKLRTRREPTKLLGRLNPRGNRRREKPIERAEHTTGIGQRFGQTSSPFRFSQNHVTCAAETFCDSGPLRRSGR